MGGCVTTTKPGERAEWEAICAETGRLADLVVIGPGSRWRFNFLSHEWTRSGAGAGLTDNIVQLFTLALEAGGRSSKQAGSDPFWRDAGQEFLRSAVDLAARANGTVSLSAIYDIIDSAPLSPEQVLSETWQSESYCFACLETADRNSTSPEQRGDYQQTERYWLRRFPQLAEKTRSIIVTGFTAMADAL